VPEPRIKRIRPPSPKAPRPQLSGAKTATAAGWQEEQHHTEPGLRPALLRLALASSLMQPPLTAHKREAFRICQLTSADSSRHGR
jgi:hypothetical protein